MILRPYQEDVRDRTRQELRSVQSTLIVMPCGAGKGTVISVMVNGAVQRKLSVIFGVDGKALVHDMDERIRKLGIPHGVLVSGKTRERWHPVQVASVDTWYRMAHLPKADLIIIDEADRALSTKWRELIAKYPKAKIVGCTATPVRRDGQGLGRASGGIFDSMVMGPSENELIAMGYLVPSVMFSPDPPPEAKTIKKSHGEFDSRQSLAVYDKPKIIGDALDKWKLHGNGFKTLAFGIDQGHAMRIKEKFSEAGYNWAYVDAKTPESERQRIWKDYDHGDLLGIAAVGVPAVGWDHSICKCLIMLANTTSLRLWRQKLGRGSRTHAGHDHFRVIDQVGGYWTHHPYGHFNIFEGHERINWSLDGEAIQAGVSDRALSVARCPKCFFTFQRGPLACPDCGRPLPKKEREFIVVSGELREVAKEAAPIRQPSPAEEPAVEKFLAFLKRGVQLGKNGSYAPYRYKIEVGSVPTKVIMEAAKRRLEREKETNA